MKSRIPIIISCLIILFACSKNNNGGGSGGGTNCSSVPKSFSADVNPIIQNFCNTAGCHAAGSTNGPGPLTNYNQVFANRAAIRSAVESGRMPQGSALTAAQKNSIICWIDSGAPNN